MHLFTSFSGRIGRGQFWLGMILLIVAGLVLAIITAPLTLAVGDGIDIIGLLLNLILLYPASAVITKRLADRGKPQTPWLWIFIVPGLLLTAMQAFGIGFSRESFGDVEVMQPDQIGMIVAAVAFIVFIWAVIELGMLKGKA